MNDIYIVSVGGDFIGSYAGDSCEEVEERVRNSLVNSDVTLTIKHNTSDTVLVSDGKTNIVKVSVEEGAVGEQLGYMFFACYGRRKYPNFVSALYKTRTETKKKLKEYLDTGKFDLYGSAEK